MILSDPPGMEPGRWVYRDNSRSREIVGGGEGQNRGACTEVKTGF